MPVDRNAKPPEGTANGDVNASNIDAKRQNATASQSGEGDPRSAASIPPPIPPQNPTAARAPANGPEHRRYRGRRRIRTRAQVRARLDELAGKLERNAIDPKTAAIMVQALNGVLSCLNAEKDEDFEKRLAAVEGKVSNDKPRKRGGDA